MYVVEFACWRPIVSAIGSLVVVRSAWTSEMLKRSLSFNLKNFKWTSWQRIPEVGKMIRYDQHPSSDCAIPRMVFGIANELVEVFNSRNFALAVNRSDLNET